jgi:hypothetical protein
MRSRVTGTVFVTSFFDDVIRMRLIHKGLMTTDHGLLTNDQFFFFIRKLKLIQTPVLSAPGQ